MPTLANCQRVSKDSMALHLATNEGQDAQDAVRIVHASPAKDIPQTSRQSQRRGSAPAASSGQYVNTHLKNNMDPASSAHHNGPWSFGGVSTDFQPGGAPQIDLAHMPQTSVSYAGGPTYLPSLNTASAGAPWPMYATNGVAFQQVPAPYQWPVEVNAAESQNWRYFHGPYQPSMSATGPDSYPYNCTPYIPSNASQYSARHMRGASIDGGGTNPTENGESAALPRGPPRKPRQSDFALWVGNLPPGTTVVDLKDHFSRDAGTEIESVKLIAKSNCAFVNYRTQAACAAAMVRFHESRFLGSKLVCRLRRSSTGSFSNGTQVKKLGPKPTPAENGLSPDHGHLSNGVSTDSDSDAPNKPIVKGRTRFFVLKSLTLQDLELSAQNGVWATQPHNELTLNEAYQVRYLSTDQPHEATQTNIGMTALQTSTDVILFFSANKSGEYFGCARMVSKIPNPGAPPEQELTAQSATPTNGPSCIPAQAIYSAEAGPQIYPTPATDTAPPGRIIDDSARGTVFWESDIGVIGTGEQSETPHSPGQSHHSSVGEELLPSRSSKESMKSERRNDSPAIVSSTFTGAPAITSPVEQSMEELSVGESEAAKQQPSGRWFQVEWLSLHKVPFYRTRGLRNPCNANREIKIARDGTEIEFHAAQRLLGLFSQAFMGQ